MSAISSSTKRTALYDKHIKLGARMGAFAGFEMPLWYTGIKDEHLAVRNKAGLFDLSHMGEFFIAGREAFDLIQYLTCNDVRRIGDGQCQYTLFPTLEGGVVDDLIVYQVTPEDYMLVVNASNIDKDFAWVVKHNTFDCEVENRSDELSLIAVQGPLTNDLLKAFGLKTIAAQKAFTFRRVKVKGRKLTVAGTGYTGERGFELIIENEHAPWLWDELISAGEQFGVQPIGLGARDTLRLEMAYSLYGHELSDTISVLDANLAWTVRFGPDFIGKDFLLKQQEQGLNRTIVGIVVTAKQGAPRHAAPVFADNGKDVGVITSGSFAPSLEKGVGLALVSPEYAKTGTILYVDIRGKRVPTQVVDLPFYKPGM